MRILKKKIKGVPFLHDAKLAKYDPDLELVKFQCNRLYLSILYYSKVNSISIKASNKQKACIKHNSTITDFKPYIKAPISKILKR